MAGISGPAGWVALAGALLAGALILAGIAGAGEAGLLKVSGLAVLAITLFATRAIPEAVTALLVFLIALAIGTAPDSVIFSGFAAGGFWLLFAGIVLGAAIVSTGLARRISGRLFAMTGASWSRALVLIAFAGLLLGVLIPSTVPRVIVLLPIAASLAERLGYPATSRGGIGLVAMAALSTLLPTYMILTANLPAIVHVGAMEQLYGPITSYSGFFVAQVPLNLIRLAVLLVLLSWFAEAPHARPAPGETEAPGLEAGQRRLLLVLSAAILLWATDFIHGIAPAWIALAAATLVLWPGAGMLGPKAMREEIDLSPVFFIAAIFSVSALARDEGLDRLLADTLIDGLGIGSGGPLVTIYAIFLFSVVLSHLTTAPAAPLVLAPFAAPLAEASGLSLEAVFMVQIIGIATPVIPYQAPPLVVAMSISAVPNAVFIRLCAALAVAVLLVGIPLTYAWWRLVGLV